MSLTEIIVFHVLSTYVSCDYLFFERNLYLHLYYIIENNLSLMQLRFINFQTKQISIKTIHF